MNEIDAARQQVEAFLDILREKHGLSESDLDSVIKQLMAFNEKATKLKKYADYVAQATITVVATAVLVGLGWSVVHFIQDIARAAGQ